MLLTNVLTNTLGRDGVDGLRKKGEKAHQEYDPLQSFFVGARTAHSALRILMGFHCIMRRYRESHTIQYQVYNIQYTRY